MNLIPDYQRQLIEFIHRSTPIKNIHRRIVLTDTLSDALIVEINRFERQSTLVISNSETVNKDARTNQQDMVKLLGSEFDIVLYDARDKFEANVFYAAAGLVGQSGCYLIVFDGNAINDAFHNLSSYLLSDSSNNAITNSVSTFQSLVVKHLRNTGVLSLFSKQLISTSKDVKVSNHNSPLNVELSEKQLDIVREITNDILTNDKSLNVIVGNRGRGKSTVLAEFICLCISKGRNVIYTSSNRNNCNVIDVKLAIKANRNGGEAKYFAPDFIAYNSMPQDAIIVIDEIASLAPRLFEKIKANTPHLVCAGTTQGYEGSGRGFAIRRMKSLSLINIHSLITPYRWHADDPLEDALQDIFPVNYSRHRVNKAIDHESLLFRSIDKSLLLKNKAQYQQVFSLLVDAHYQTTPSDVQRIIDDESHIIVGLYHENEVLGIAVLVQESASRDKSFNRLVAYGKRRRKGNLFQQNIALHLLEPLIMGYSFLRIHRIAVPAHYQRNGIGTRLLNCISEQYNKDEVVLCTTFGMTAELHHFWHKNKYRIVKIGKKIDAASGTISGFYILENDVKMLNSRFDLMMNLQLHKNYSESFEPHIFKNYPSELLEATICSEKLLPKVSLFSSSDVPYERVKEAIFFLSIQIEDEYLQDDIASLAKKGISKEARDELELKIRVKIKNPAFTHRVLRVK